MESGHVLKISKINIKNYRRFLDTRLNLERNDLVVLAGANNSGKTSLIQLLNTVFKNKQNISEKDISIQKRQNLISDLENEIGPDNLTLEEYKEKVLLFFKEKEIKEYTINLQFTVSYDVGESITLFSDYLMDLDENKKEFYFEFRNEYSFSLFENYLLTDELSELYKLHVSTNEHKASMDKASAECKESLLKKTKEYHRQKNQYEKLFFKIFGNCLKNSYYYSDATFNILRKMEFNEFSKLFVFDFISADRELDDESTKNKKITTSVIESTDRLTENFSWKDQFEQLYKAVDTGLKDSGIESTLQESTLSAFSTIKDNMDLIGDTKIDAIEAIMEFDEKILLSLIKDSISINYIYHKDNSRIYLGEESQGLGISNLIFISLQIIKFRNQVKAEKVNFFVIEEPEAHMHIQMQRVLIKFLEDLFSKDTYIQGMISTHSSEIVRNSNLTSLKIIRPTDPFENKISDLQLFIKENGSDREFYETFFKINFSNLIFCDKAIIYEGDTERMFIESVISRDSEYSELSTKYISYCQAGGAYAHKYFKLISELGIKLCVFTDMDYSKDQDDMGGLLDDSSTNATLNNQCTKDGIGKVLVRDIYEWQKKDRLSGSHIQVFTQGEIDGFARTLEEAILYRLIRKEEQHLIELLKEDVDLTEDLKQLNVFTRLPLLFWKKLKEESGFEISLPSSKKEIEDLKKIHENNSIELLQALQSLANDKDRIVKRSIRDIVKSISNNKSDFMYSIIASGKQSEVLPKYIREGLLWL